jgi:hypothetical protein
VLFGAFAPISKKSFIKDESKAKPILVSAEHLKNYAKVYASIEEYEADQK